MDRANTPARINLRSVALATAVVVGVASTAAVAYLLLDVLLLLFIGIIVAAALQPWHVLLNQRGIPKGFAVLMIYVLILTALVSIAIVVGPLIIEQVGTFTDDLPRSYAAVRAWLTHSSSGALEFLGARMPPFERLAPSFSTVAPELYKGTLGVTVGLVKLGVYFVSVFAIGFYWTIEVARFERLIVSLLPVAHRTRALTVWHEIESKLGGFMRGQGMAMLFVGAVSGIGYALIGLPNAIPLGILAGLFEAVPLIGPILAVGPAVLVSLSVGGNSVFAVLVLAAVVHLFESNVLIPRIMHRAVGVSYLVSLLALLAFGTLYGIIGVLIAVPMAAVIQVVLDTLVISAESVPVVEGVLESPADELRARVQALRQHARVRLRARSSRMGIDPSTTDHLVDAVDQQIEAAAAHIDRLISVSEDASQPVPTAAIMEALHGVTEEIEHAVEQVDETITEEVDESLVADLNHATERFQAAITQIEKLVVCEPKSDPTAKLQPLASRRPGIPPRAA